MDQLAVSLRAHTLQAWLTLSSCRANTSTTTTTCCSTPSPKNSSSSSCQMKTSLTGRTISIWTVSLKRPRPSKILSIACSEHRPCLRWPLSCRSLTQNSPPLQGRRLQQIPKTKIMTNNLSSLPHIARKRLLNLLFLRKATSGRRYNTRSPTNMTTSTRSRPPISTTESTSPKKPWSIMTTAIQVNDERSWTRSSLWRPGWQLT